MVSRSFTVLFVLLAVLTIAMSDTAHAQSKCVEGIKQEEAKIDDWLIKGKGGKKVHSQLLMMLGNAREALAKNQFKKCVAILKKVANINNRL